MPKKKRYFFSVAEEMVMNPKREARFLIPEAFMVDFRRLWDSKESDKMPYIRWDCGLKEDGKR